MSTPRYLAAVAALGFALEAPATAANPLLTIPGGTLRVAQRGAATILVVTMRGHIARAVLPEEDGIFARSLQETQVVGIVPGELVILRSDYQSRPNGGSHQCGAGTETVLRVIMFRPALRQVLHQRVESCWQTIEPGAVAWNGSTRTLTVERTTFDPDARHLRTEYRIEPDGVPTQLRVQELP